jgi:hypothetical protein
MIITKGSVVRDLHFKKPGVGRFHTLYYVFSTSEGYNTDSTNTVYTLFGCV